MPQIKIENEYDIKGIRAAVGEIRKCVARQKRYSIYYSWIFKTVHVIPEGKPHDSDWLLVEADLPWAYDQGRLVQVLNKFIKQLEKNLQP